MPRFFRKSDISFYPYVIQIGDCAEVLYVNYATDVDRAFGKFIHSHSRIRNSVLRNDLCDSSLSYSRSDVADRACRRLIENLESVGYEVIAGGPLHNNYWQVYVIEIEGNPRHLYVGETNYPVEKRYQQHVYRFNPARELLKYNNFDLAMEHAEGWPKVSSKEASLRNESELAETLRKKGYKVEGGH